MKRSLYQLTSFALALTCYAADAGAHTPIGARGGQAPAASSAQARPTPASVSAQLNGGRVGAASAVEAHRDATRPSPLGPAALNAGRMGSADNVGGHFNARPAPTGSRNTNLQAGGVSAADRVGGQFNARPAPTGNRNSNLDGGRMGSADKVGGHFHARPAPTGDRGTNVDGDRMGSGQPVEPKADAGRPTPAPSTIGFSSTGSAKSVLGNASADRALSPLRTDEQFFFHANSVQSKSQANRSRGSAGRSR